MEHASALHKSTNRRAHKLFLAIDRPKAKQFFWISFDPQHKKNEETMTVNKMQVNRTQSNRRMYYEIVKTEAYNKV